MAEQVCPHCGATITNEDLTHQQLWQEFCETEAYKSLSKKDEHWFWAGCIVMMFSLFGGLSFTPSIYVLLGVFCGVVVGVPMVVISFYHQRRRSKVFEEFKSTRAAS